MSKIRFFWAIFLFVFTINCANASNFVWTNNLRSMFVNNLAVIYTINIRTFGAVDYNENDIIELELGEVGGTFTNAIPKLKALAANGINTIYLLPITKTGKLKALGTAGSLYALDSFDTINPQFYDSGDYISDIKLQAKKFVEAAHKLKMHVIIDLPSCGSYDLSLENPGLFVRDKNGEAVTPADWTDVRLFRVYNDDKTLNPELLAQYKNFVNLVQYIGADGIRADVAAIKPKEFWKEIIDYARNKDPQFLFLAEASPKWTNPVKNFAPYATIEELLEAGFDGFYADWSNLKEIKNTSDFENKINEINKIVNKFGGQKSVIANFATHDQISPSRLGYPYWQMVNWLNMTLPINPYILDGFPAADPYLYKFENKTAQKSYTDDDNYFLHKGKFDIFNFSRAPYSINSKTFVSEFGDAVHFRYMMGSLIAKKEVNFLKTNNPSVFAFMKQSGGDSVVIIGNLDSNSPQKAKINIPKLEKDDFIMPFKMDEAPVAAKGHLNAVLRPYEIQVLVIRKTLSLKK